MDEVSYKLGELTNAIKEAHKKIDQNGEKIDRVLKAQSEQNTVCATTRQKFENQIDLNDDRINSLEESGVPSKTKKQINVNSIVATINLAFTIIKSWMGLP